MDFTRIQSSHEFEGVPGNHLPRDQDGEPRRIRRNEPCRDHFLSSGHRRSHLRRGQVHRGIGFVTLKVGGPDITVLAGIIRTEARGEGAEVRERGSRAGSVGRCRSSVRARAEGCGFSKPSASFTRTSIRYATELRDVPMLVMNSTVFREVLFTWMP